MALVSPSEGSDGRRRRQGRGIAALLERMRARWQAWSLSRQFGTCASLVMLPAMLVMGLWVSDRIQDSVTRGAGTSAALYIENFVEPLLQDLVHDRPLLDDSRRRIERLLVDTSLGQRVLTFKIWAGGGKVIASNRSDVVGKVFPPSERLKRAWAGEVTSGFDHLKDDENEAEKRSGIPLLELYIPIRARGQERVIAVAEFYEKAPELKAELAHARAMSWMIVAAVTLAMLAALSAIVRTGSRTIEEQRGALERRVDELTTLLAENRQLRQRAHLASALASESSEAYLRRLGADLHDGPAQLISLALLRLGSGATAGSVQGANGQDERPCVRAVLGDALKDIRNILSGLVLPEIDGLSAAQTIEMVVSRHRQLTGSEVGLNCTGLPEQVSPAMKQCLYRIAQEGLANAFRHGGGIGQSVTAVMERGAINITIADRGLGFAPEPGGAGAGLGIRGLTNRIESLGGSLRIDANPGGGTRLVARLPLSAGDHIDV